VRRVAITGYGIQSCLGNTRAEVLEALKAGRSGIVLYPERKQLGFRSALGGLLVDPPELPFPRKTVRQMGPSPKIAAYAALQAIEHAGLPEALVRDERTAMIIGHGGCMQDVYQQCSDFEEGKTLPGTALQRVMCDTVSANLSILFGTRGFSFTVSAACATGAAAVGQAYQLIQWGLQDRALCGGAMENTWEFASHFDALKALSLREGEPTRASRPFDRGRDGLVPSGGGSILVLEEWEAAVARGAPILAELVGYSFTSDAHDMTVPSGEGGLRAMRAALEQGGLGPADVDYVNAHATSTTVGDAVEARAIEQLFGRWERGARVPRVSSTKSMTGHESGAAGSNELVYTLLMMEHGFCAPSINIDELDPECSGIRIVANQAEDARIDAAISNSFGFGGVNTCLALRRA
jgi:3-oxoacyl-[acyl-carrier-protein] synthase-1